MVGKNFLRVLALGLIVVFAMGADECRGKQEARDQELTSSQQTHLRRVHPLPWFDYSRELEIYTQIYKARNRSVATHTVWRSDFGMIEGDCPSIGFPVPYDVQVTNPLQVIGGHSGGPAVVEQAEPNGLFSSKATSATWIPCAGDDGSIFPIYVESKVTCYPYLVEIDYSNNRVVKTKGAKPSVSIKVDESKLKGGGLGVAPVVPK